MYFPKNVGTSDNRRFGKATLRHDDETLLCQSLTKTERTPVPQTTHFKTKD